MSIIGKGNLWRSVIYDQPDALSFIKACLARHESVSSPTLYSWRDAYSKEKNSCEACFIKILCKFTKTRFLALFEKRKERMRRLFHCE